MRLSVDVEELRARVERASRSPSSLPAAGAAGRDGTPSDAPGVRKSSRALPWRSFAEHALFAALGGFGEEDLRGVHVSLGDGAL
jgi:hypothetical protein